MISTLGRYKVISEIGQGAMGTVYKAVDPIIDRTVAIKTINLNLSRQELEEYEARFQQEIKARGGCTPTSPPDVGKTDQVAYMAMGSSRARAEGTSSQAASCSRDQVVDIIAGGRRRDLHQQTSCTAA